MARGVRRGHLSPVGIIRLLEPLYGPASPPREWEPLAELVYTVLSQNTSDRNSYRAYHALRRAFPTWEAVAEAPDEAIASAIRIGGLARVKAPRIKAILKAIGERAGRLDLSFLKTLGLKKARAWLTSLPGVGPKTAACVLLFSLGQPAMPVDTHIHRLARRLGLIEDKVSAEAAHEILERLVKPEDYLRFHVYLITHGRKVCKAQRPLCEGCVLEPGCPSSRLL